MLVSKCVDLAYAKLLPVALGRLSLDDKFHPPRTGPFNGFNDTRLLPSILFDLLELPQFPHHNSVVRHGLVQRRLRVVVPRLRARDLDLSLGQAEQQRDGLLQPEVLPGQHTRTWRGGIGRRGLSAEPRFCQRRSSWSDYSVRVE